MRSTGRRYMRVDDAVASADRIDHQAAAKLAYNYRVLAAGRWR